MPTAAAITKTWRYSVNNQIFGDTDLLHRANLAYEIKRRIIGGGDWTDASGSAAAGPTAWTVVASSNSVIANAADNWLSAANCVWDTPPDAHSWCLFRCANYFGTGLPLEMLLHLSEASSATRNATMGVVLSRDGFDITTPVVTARPTATDEIVVLTPAGIMTNAAWQGSDSSTEEDRVGWLHFLMTPDGRSLRIIIGRENVCVSLWDMFRMDDWLSGANATSHPVAMMIASRDSSAELCTWANLQGTTYMQYVSRDTVAGQYRMRIAGPVSANTNTSASAWGTCSLGGANSSGLHTLDLEGVTPLAGYVTTLADLWMGRAANAGGHYPDSAPFTKAQTGILVSPWNGPSMSLGS